MEETGNRSQEAYPAHTTLIRLHLHENNPETALHWYDNLPKGRRALGNLDESVAQAVLRHAPERAVGIWKAMAEDLIAMVNPKAYQKAAAYLRKASKVMVHEKRSGEWEEYIQELRRIHARKYRLIEVLDKMDGKPILRGAKR